MKETQENKGANSYTGLNALERKRQKQRELGEMVIQRPGLTLTAVQSCDTEDRKVFKTLDLQLLLS